MSEIKVKPVRLARFELPDFHPEAPGFDTVYGFLIRDGEECVLVDTGVGSGSSVIERLYKPERVDLATALESVGESLGQISAVVNSHLHFDHCGNNSLFPGIPIFVQQAELEAARQPHYTIAEWIDFPNSNYVPIVGNRFITAHLELLSTPGHTPGHQSLAVRSKDQLELIVAQAAYTTAEFQFFANRGTDTPEESDRATYQTYIRSNATWSEDAYVASLQALHQLQPRRAFFSHDRVVWATDREYIQ